MNKALNEMQKDKDRLVQELRLYTEEQSLLSENIKGLTEQSNRIHRLQEQTRELIDDIDSLLPKEEITS